MCFTESTFRSFEYNDVYVRIYNNDLRLIIMGIHIFVARERYRLKSKRQNKTPD